MEKQQEEAAQRAATKSTRMRREDMRFVSATGRGVFESLFNPPRTDVREMFLPRRTAFVFEFDSSEGGDTDIPTTLRRSKADCPPPQECRFAGTDGAVLERISKILSYIKVSGAEGG
jgi:IK cytokine